MKLCNLLQTRWRTDAKRGAGCKEERGACVEELFGQGAVGQSHGCQVPAQEGVPPAALLCLHFRVFAFFFV